MLIVCNYELIANLFQYIEPELKYILLSVIEILILMIVTILLYKRKEEIAVTCNNLFCLVFAALILMNAVPAVPVIMDKSNVSVEGSKDILSTLNVDSVNKKNAPNIYYMIFDEYAGPTNLKKYYNFDNAEFMNYLTEKKFNISRTSFNQESTDTCTVIPNLLNLKYTVEDSMPQLERLEYLQSPYIYDLMEFLGYDINTASFPTFLNDERSRSSYSGGSVFETKAGYFILENSIFIHWYRKNKETSENGVDRTTLTFGEILIETMDYYKTFAEDSKRLSKPQFNLGYFQAPHIDFYFTEDGSTVPYERCQIWEDQSIYLGYMKWTNHKIEEIIDNILKNDPKAIIIIQSDHGARYVRHGREQGYSTEGLDPKFEKNILNCVYYKGKTLDIEGLSGINTVRTILNEQYGTKLKMVKYKKQKNKEK